MQIRAHVEVLGSDGRHVGTVDHVDGHRSKRTKSADPDGSGPHRHTLPMRSVGSLGGNRVTRAIAAGEARQQAPREGDISPDR